ncbi:allophanate hydrolase [Rhodoferax koreense]|uniref:Allophanate hydrolase n=1 Tax=Rhodoferax koreensis TaxID=1842727 RepID=A0A1P8JUL2_9BURK|nr:biotin-dependent carboxyltransferase family protein [Rhodoferax koreense]APW37425.1 allophanate hydrolase [Rhodoferax koreense]
MIEILSSTALATVQDAGRLGSLRFGVGTAGAMDQLALTVGNLLLGNPEGAAALEIPVYPFQVRFTEDCAFALTGADGQARLDGQAIAPWWVGQARQGQVLTIGLPVPNSGSRAYLALCGGIDVPEVLASRSTQLRGAFGGLDGRAVRQGDVLRAARPGAQPAVDFGVVPPAIGLPLTRDGLPAMRVLPAAEYACFKEASRAAFWAGEWKITAQSDRYGYRLQGTPLEPIAHMEIRSHGIVPGVIQVPSGGQPIVQMRDAQPSGGYPKFGTVIEADLWRLGQAAIGSRVRFVETTYEEAVAAQGEVQAWLDEARRMIELQRWAQQRK